MLKEKKNLYLFKFEELEEFEKLKKLKKFIKNDAKKTTNKRLKDAIKLFSSFELLLELLDSSENEKLKNDKGEKSRRPKENKSI